MEKNLIVWFDASQEYGPEWTRDITHMLEHSGLSNYRIKWCKNNQEFTETLQQEGEKIRCIFLDEDAEERAERGSVIAQRLRQGGYGDTLKTVPAAIISGGDIPVMQVSPPVICIDKGDSKWDAGSFGDILAFIKTPSLTTGTDPQSARNHNAEVLINILGANTGSKLDIIRAFRQSPEAGIDTAQEGITYLRYLYSNAFAGGAPDGNHLQRLQAALNVPGIYIEHEGLANQLTLLVGQIKTAVHEALGKTH